MKWFNKGKWVELLKDGYRNMPKEHKREFIEESWQQHLKFEYELALEFQGVDGQDWDDLSQEEKIKERAASKPK